MNYVIFIYLLYWIVLSERFTMEGIVVGIFISFIVLYFNKSTMSKTEMKKSVNLSALKYWCLFVLGLIRDIIKANFHVAKIVLSPNLDINPSTLKIKTTVKSPLYRVILANSITLTPGTLTINLEDNELLVHCLDEGSAKGLYDLDMERLILKAEE